METSTASFSNSRVVVNSEIFENNILKEENINEQKEEHFQINSDSFNQNCAWNKKKQ